MSRQEPLSRTSVAIAISESSDMAALGLAPEHLRDAMAEIARHLLALGARLVYGGDLRAGGFTELLFELSERHRRDADVGDMRPAIVNFLAWPVHGSMPTQSIESLIRDLEGLAEIVFLDVVGKKIVMSGIAAREPAPMNDGDWIRGLAAMRDVLTQATDARIVLGGRVTDFKGTMPGIAEEALTSLRAQQPLYLLGGFGGCARDLAIQLGLLPTRDNRSSWHGLENFQDFDGASLVNGLSMDENRTLARTVHVDEAVALILRGLLRLAEVSKNA